MKILCKVLAIICAIAVVGHLTVGNFFPIGILLAAVFGYFGWREPKSVDI